MSQIRLTQKVAKDLHIISFAKPQETISIYDDWVIDVIRVQRKKVVMMIHVKSYLPFFIPYQTIGGAQNIAHMLGMLFSEWVIKKGYEKHCKAINELFSQPTTFCKIANRKVLGHMNDYKRCVPFAWQDVSFENIDWELQTEGLVDMPITVSDSLITYPTPGKLMLDLLERDL